MKTEADALWERAIRTLQSARTLFPQDPDSSASRSYYAAFYAVSALFALQGIRFSKHSAVAATVHRDLVRDGHWPKELGERYSSLLRLRTTADYGIIIRASEDEAGEAIETAAQILQAVYKSRPEVFSDPDEVK